MGRVKMSSKRTHKLKLRLRKERERFIEEDARRRIDLSHQKARLIEAERDRLSGEIERMQLEHANDQNLQRLIEEGVYPLSDDIERKILITLDGGNGTGKSTLIKTLGSAFEGAGHTNYAIFKESSLSTLFEGARGRAKHHEGYRSSRDREHAIGSVVTAGRLIEARDKLIERLRASKEGINISEGIIMLDRYVWTTLAFQLGAGRSLYEAIGTISNTFVLPNASVILTCDPEVARSRAANRYLETTGALDGGKQMEDIEDLRDKTESYRKFVKLMHNGYPDFRLVHYDTTSMTKEEVARAVINDIIKHYVTEDTARRMLERIDMIYQKQSNGSSPESGEHPKVASK